MPRRSNEEEQMCINIIKAVRGTKESMGLMAIYPCLKLLHHVSNEGKRNPKTAKGIGILAGVADYDLPVPTVKYIGLKMEIKAPGKKPTAPQVWYLERCAAHGHYSMWTDDVQSAIDVLMWYAGEAQEFERLREVATVCGIGLEMGYRVHDHSVGKKGNK